MPEFRRLAKAIAEARNRRNGAGGAAHRANYSSSSQPTGLLARILPWAPEQVEKRGRLLDCERLTRWAHVSASSHDALLHDRLPAPGAGLALATVNPRKLRAGDRLSVLDFGNSLR